MTAMYQDRLECRCGAKALPGRHHCAACAHDALARLDAFWRTTRPCGSVDHPLPEHPQMPCVPLPAPDVCEACGGLHSTRAHHELPLALLEADKALGRHDVSTARSWIRVAMKLQRRSP